MKIKILSPWKQDAELKAREENYIKRLRRHASLELVEIKGEKGCDRTSVEKEGKKLLAHIDKVTFLVALTEWGKTFSSTEFSGWIEDMGIKGRSDVTFVVGGAAGIGTAVMEAADLELSLSPMTFPHQMAKLILIEQIYRAFSIINKEPYHK